MNGGVVGGVALSLLLVRERRPNVPFEVVPVGSGLAVDPAVAVLVLAVAAGLRLAQRHRLEAAQAARADADVSLAARVLLISLSAGLPLSAGLNAACDRVGDLMHREISSLLRRSARLGMAEALRCHEGRLGRLTLLLARAHVTGASISDAVQAFVNERRDDERAAELEAARKLPVKLTIPLALLILPGFVVLTVGPSVLDSAQRLLGPVLPVP